MTTKLAVLESLRRRGDGTLPLDTICGLKYPTAISQLLKSRIAEIDTGHACLEMGADGVIQPIERSARNSLILMGPTDDLRGLRPSAGERGRRE